MARRHFRREEDEAEIDITPMLDMVFILLIFFIVTSSFANVAGVHVSRPSKSNQQVVKQSKVVLIQISASGSVSVNGTQMSLATVKAEVSKDLAANPDSQVVVAASPHADAGNLVEVIDRARQAGAKKVSIATTEG
jgi:biopolymer transport protein ExbD